MTSVVANAERRRNALVVIQYEWRTLARGRWGATEAHGHRLGFGPIKFTVREEGTFNPELLKMQLAPDQPFQVRLTAAMFSGFGQRLWEGYVAQATRLRIGEIDIAHLPGELFVEFQLFAQQVATRNSFTCVAGYGECGVWYYGPDHIFTDRGGYEQTWSLTGPCQRTVEEALTTLLVREPLPKQELRMEPEHSVKCRRFRRQPNSLFSPVGMFT